MQPADIASVARWISETPLWRRYQLTALKAAALLETGRTAGDLLIVADLDEWTACGLAWCVRRGMFGRDPYLKLFGVQDSASGRGVGSRLLHDLTEALDGETNLFLLVSDFNTEAQGFYQRHGFVQVGELEGYVLPDVTERLLRRPLGRKSPANGSNRMERVKEREEP